MGYINMRIRRRARTPVHGADAPAGPRFRESRANTTRRRNARAKQCRRERENGAPGGRYIRRAGAHATASTESCRPAPSLSLYGSLLSPSRGTPPPRTQQAHPPLCICIHTLAPLSVLLALAFILSRSFPLGSSSSSSSVFGPHEFVSLQPPRAPRSTGATACAAACSVRIDAIQ